MALLEVVETSQEHVVDLRHDLNMVRDALDRTDAVLEIADNTLTRAEDALIASRRYAPVVLGVIAIAGLAGVVAIGVVISLRRRRQARTDEQTS